MLLPAEPPLQDTLSVSVRTLALRWSHYNVVMSNMTSLLSATGWGEGEKRGAELESQWELGVARGLLFEQLYSGEASGERFGASWC